MESNQKVSLSSPSQSVHIIGKNYKHKTNIRHNHFKLSIQKRNLQNCKIYETLGVTRRGKLVLRGEDTAFCQVIRNSEYKLLYTPHAKVYHQINNERIRIPYIVKHALHGGITKTRIFLNKKQSRIWAIRYALGISYYILHICIVYKPYRTR